MNQSGFSKIIQTKGLTDEQHRDIASLINICDTHDKPDQKLDRTMPPPKGEAHEYLLYSDGSQLIAYMGIHPSASQSEVRITGIVHPAHRRQGIFSSLLARAKELCGEQNVTRLTLIVEDNSESGQAFAHLTGAKKTHSSYKMRFDKQRYQVQPETGSTLTIRPATFDDLTQLVQIGMQGFGTTEIDEREYNESNLKNPERKMFIAHQDNLALGAISVVMHGEEGYICDLAVLTDYRGRGIGGNILRRTINQLLEQGIEELSLSVMTQNRNALSLYEKCGFGISAANHFFALQI